MTKAEQEWSLIEALDYCKGKRILNKCCAGCPYAGVGCAIDVVIAKLKAQEPVEPVFDAGNGKTIGQFLCGKCHAKIGFGHPHFCWYCGRKVKWDG